MVFRAFLLHPTFFSVAMMQNDIGIMLQKITLSKQALRVPPPPTFQEYLVFRGTQPVLQFSEQLAVHRPGPDDFRKANKYSPHIRRVLEVHILSAS